MGDTVGVMAGDNDGSAPIIGESGGVRGRFARGDGWWVNVRVSEGLAEAVGGRYVMAIALCKPVTSIFWGKYANVACP